MPARRAFTACPLDCPDACALEVSVEDGRVGRIDARADGPPLTAGFICSKVRGFARQLEGEARIATPLARVGPRGSGGFRAVGWDEALTTIAGRLLEARDRFGGESILPYSYGGSNGLLSQDRADALLFRRLGASRLERTVCAAPSGRAVDGLYGKMEGISPLDYEHARLIVVWGANPQASGIHLVPIVERARARGARLIVVDPRRVGLAARADLHLALRPGTDLAVALAVIRELARTGRVDSGFLERHADGWPELEARAQPWTLERAAATAGVAIDDLRRFVDLYAGSSPAALRCGWGLERNRNGGSAVAAVLALPAVAGKFGVRGGGYTLSNSGAWRFEPHPEPAPPTRAINMNRLGQALTELNDPPVRVLFVYNSNALATSPDQNRIRRGLGREDLFTVVFDSTMTDTALWADLVLPATTFLEHRELSRGYGNYVLHRIEPVVERFGEARPNQEVFAELAVRCGVAAEGEIPDAAATERQLLAAHPDGARLAGELDLRGWATPPCGDRPVQFVDVFPRTPGGRVRLVPEELDRECPGGLYAFREDPAPAAFPLALISPATGRTISSSLGQLHDGPVPLEMHPEDAAARGLRSGDPVRVYNRLGEVHVPLRVSATLRPGVVSLPKGLWARQTANASTANALVPDALADLGGGACFNDARVEVERRPTRA